jgi:hypothetical protein
MYIEDCNEFTNTKSFFIGIALIYYDFNNNVLGLKK